MVGIIAANAEFSICTLLLVLPKPRIEYVTPK